MFVFHMFIYDFYIYVLLTCANSPVSDNNFLTDMGQI